MKTNRILLLVVAIALFIPGPASGQVFEYDFQTGYQGWSGDFADYPATDSVFYELAFRRTNLPLPLDTARFGLMITGNNHSDDLFMFIRKEITGLSPKTHYRLGFEVELASEAPTNAIGIGGAPGESVFFKAGGSVERPQKVNDGGFFILNIDKGNQSNPGRDMDTLGHIGVSDTTTVFTLITRTNAGHLFPVTADETGAVWICIGTDSGFEGTTTLYYSRIRLTFDPETGVGHTPENEFTDPVVYPNPAHEFLNIPGLVRSVGLFDPQGRQVLSRQSCNQLDIRIFDPGFYVLKIRYENGLEARKKIIIE